VAEENLVHPLLERELDLVQDMYSQNALETRVHGGIDEMDIFINIDLNTFLDEHMASAWGVSESQPLIILLHILSISKYLEGLEPKVNVFQAVVKDDVAPTASAYDASTKRRKIGISSQLEKILQAFVSKQWRKISVSTVERAMSGETPSSKTPGTRHRVDPREDAKLAKLVEMGFRAEEAREALHQCQGDVEAACELLATTPSGASSSGGGSGFLSSLVSFLPGYTRQDSMGAQLEVTEHHDPEEDKRIPSLEKGFLVQVVRYALNRLKSLNEFCVICDEKHVLESGLIKPCVCTRELCVFAFQTLGVMADAAEAIATDRDVVDLLIAMANSAAHSPRAGVILDPFPSIVDPSNVNVLALDPQKKDFDLMKRVIKEVVSTRVSLETRDCINLKQKMDETNPLAFPLLQWIIATCRAHIVLLPEPRQLKSMNTKHQFLLISSPPANEVAFQQAKQKHGSTYAFHGSSIENWHRIMRKGLVNASGTKFQLHGAAYGKGIYLSPVSTVSFGYTGGLFYMPTTRHRQDVQCLANKINLKCLALCEGMSHCRVEL
jgi:poly [ADP-ribose] polymerase 6/8